MEAMFYVVPGSIMAVALTMAFVAVRHTLRLRRAWRSGLTADALPADVHHGARRR
ncbi:hypothetical protein [Streptomyces sp. NPDC001292]|uniref:hypothetical protein n=1 Tax=Streptomyces sp. NPDC001292 TaxID=3364558 RepID=UPI003681D6BE